MTREEFSEALLRFGAKLEAWPRTEAEAARRLVEQDPAAANMLAKFSAFERTLAYAVTPPPFGAAEIGAVLKRLDEREEGWRPSWQFWMAGVGASALSFAAGVAVMLFSVSAQSQIDLPLSMIGLALGQADLGGLL